MKFAPIIPPHILRNMHPPTSYHLVLGQELLRDAEYFDYYKGMCWRRGDFIIVDNGAAENDTPPFHEIVEVANRLGAQEIALPDKLFDWNETVRLHYTIGMEMVPARKRMIIPQGDSIRTWIACCRELMANMDFRSIGVPKHLEQHEGGRAAALRWLHNIGAAAKYDVHLLGVWNHAYTEIQAAKQALPLVRGIDTGAPVAIAQRGELITHLLQDRASLDWHASADEKLVAYNIRKVTSWCLNGN